jgi:hypothetical protein
MHLRDLVRYHAEQEQRELVPALRCHAPEELYAKLAGAFATERLRQLSMLQPSAPLYFDVPRTEVVRVDVVRSDVVRTDVIRTGAHIAV